MVACPNCGKENSDTAKHCGFCGSKLQVQKAKSTMFGMAAVDPAELERVRKAFEQQTSSVLQETRAETDTPPPKPVSSLSAGVPALSRPTRKLVEKPKDIPLSISGSAPALSRPKPTAEKAPADLSDLLSDQNDWNLDQGWDASLPTPGAAPSVPVEDMGFAETIDAKRDAVHQAIAQADAEEKDPARPRGTLLGMNIHDGLAAAKAKALADVARDGSLGIQAPISPSPEPEPAFEQETPDTPETPKGTLLGFGQVQPSDIAAAHAHAQAQAASLDGLPTQTSGSPKTVPVGSVPDISLSGPVPSPQSAAPHLTPSEPSLDPSSGPRISDGLDFPGPGSFESSFDHDEEPPKPKTGLIIAAIVGVVLLLAAVGFFVLNS